MELIVTAAELRPSTAVESLGCTSHLNYTVTARKYLLQIRKKSGIKTSVQYYSGITHIFRDIH